VERRSVVLTSLHAQLLSIDLIGLWLAFAVVLTPVAVLVLSSAVRDWFHALRIFLCGMSENCIFNRVIL
jgi:hypothetical protein